MEKEEEEDSDGEYCSSEAGGEMHKPLGGPLSLGITLVPLATWQPLVGADGDGFRSVIAAETHEREAASKEGAAAGSI